MVIGPSPGPGPGPGSAPAAQARASSSRLTPVQLADVAPPEAAQKGPQGGWRLDHAADGASRPASAQHVGVVDAVAAGQRRRHQRHHLVVGVGSARRVAQVEALPDQLGQTQVLGQRGGKDQPGIVDQAVVVEGDVDAVGMVAW